MCNDNRKIIEIFLEKIENILKENTTETVSKANSSVFSFNDEIVNPIKAEEDNYSITIRDQKDFGNLKSDFGKALDGFFQNQHESRFLGNDYITMLALKKKMGIEYYQVPMLKPGQKPRCIADKSRINKCMSSYTERTELAKLELEGKQNQSLIAITAYFQVL